MKKAIGIVLALIMILSIPPCAFAEGLLLVEGENELPFDGTLEFGLLVSDWAREEVESAIEINIVPEKLIYENLTKNVTRAEFAAIAVTLYENLIGQEVYIDTDSMPFDDIDKSLYVNEIIAAYGLEITNGTSENTFSPDALITREQMATMLLRTLSVAEIDTTATNEISFADNDEISDYARDAVSFMSETGIINGVGDNKFAPKATATREQAILIAYRSVVTFEKETLGNALKAEFEQIAEYGNAYEIAESLVTSPAVTELNLVAMEIEEGYLAGFDNAEISGFEEGAMFAPMIGTIPFVGYIFTVTDNVDTFIKKLEESANLRWNICTRAEEMVTGKAGNKVFFVMCPESL